MNRGKGKKYSSRLQRIGFVEEKGGILKSNGRPLGG